MARRLCWPATLTALLACPLFAQDDASGDIKYNRDIRPILAEHCFACHGTDSVARKADLRLDQRDAAIDSGAISANHPDDSELIARIESDDADVVMPPPTTKKTMTAQQKNLLRQWIESGAEYEALSLIHI